ncbi:MAG TPA: class I SAM-dependent methyltransferase [Gaiellaceae bacterium]|nr:class I SAM-dependent methyltransferase [Gaiellaceae bacterium]
MELVCPRDHSLLARENGSLRCAEGAHQFELRDGVPLLLLADEAPTQEGYWATGAEVYRDDPLEFEAGKIDPYVRKVLVGTCGNLYLDVDRFTSYPIPQLRLPAGEGRSLLDIGCNWGRWTIAAARKGYAPVGVDPAFGAIQAAGRVTAELGAEAEYVVGDARHLPFPDGSFDTVFSYGVLQHFSPPDALLAIAEMGRVCRPGGTALLQMPGRYGLRNLQQQARRGFSEGAHFDVRYWSPRRLRDAFEQAVGPTRLEVDGYFTLNPQAADLALLPPARAALVRVSEALRRVADWAPPLVHVADSVYVRAVRRA